MLLEDMREHLFKVYGDALDDSYFSRLQKLLDEYKLNMHRKELWDETDVFLITYGDSILQANEAPLKTLNIFLNQNVKQTFSTVHILPFFPYSSDDGFAVKNFYEVNPQLGTWNDIEPIGKSYRLMGDLVVNHASSQSEWFEQFINNEPPGKDYFYEPKEDFITDSVIRPRSSPLITNFQSVVGVKRAWTTFSADQVDLNYANPELLLEVIKIILFYIGKNISVIRLDAIAFIWKESNTQCVHLPETHEIIKLLRKVVDYCAPGVILITETNVPHLENISYYGNGDEAHMVYQFPLPPLLLYTLNKGNARVLTKWAESLDDPGENRTWFNFTASHDGIGVRPLEGLVESQEKYDLVNNMVHFGGLVSNRRAFDGREEPYEINITYFDALKGVGNVVDNFQFERFICSQSIMLALKGVPAIYIQSLFGAANDYNGAAQQLMNRAINRRKYELHEVQEIVSGTSIQSKVFNELKRLVAIRKEHIAFHPDAHQEILDIGTSFFAMLRKNIDAGEKVLCISNITNREKSVVSVKHLGHKQVDLLSGALIEDKEVRLNPYQSVWLLSLDD